MTTVTEDLQLSWDYFTRQGEGFSEQALRMIDGWRRTEWDSIVRYLLQDYHWEIPEGLEPHWVGPGKARYWQEQTKLERTFVDNETGDPLVHTGENLERGHMEGVWVTIGWEPTGPLPAANAGQVAHYLNKGLRLRPPREGVAAEIWRESADLPEAPSEAPPAPYTCFRHGEKGKMAFANWKAYIKHCTHYNEPPKETPPQEVLERMARFQWYCLNHDIGFNHKAHVTRHFKAEMRRAGRPFHMTVEDMQVQKNGSNA